MEEYYNLRLCPECEREVPREDMSFTCDCHGISFRLVCNECWNKIMDERGYDREHYDERDECLDYDY